MLNVSRGRALTLATFTLLIAACARGSEVKVGTPVVPAGDDGSVRVELAEWSVKAPPSAKAGKVMFTAKNGGSTPHELVVLRTNTDAGALQRNASGVVDEGKNGVVAKTRQVAEGGTEPLDATLAPGKYVLICNVPGHYGLGMRTAFTVD